MKHLAFLLLAAVPGAFALPAAAQVPLPEARTTHKSLSEDPLCRPERERASCEQGAQSSRIRSDTAMQRNAAHDWRSHAKPKWGLRTGSKSPGKAVALSLLLPGLGHRYAHDGSWRGAASLFALADASFWLGLLGADWRHGQVVQSYETLARGRAGASIEGKDRRFFLNLAAYMSSDAFLEAQLRNRAWDQVAYVGDPAFQWHWASEADLQEYRRLRDEADTWSRRRTLFLSTLVANRLLAGLTALRAANRANNAAPDVSLSLSPPLPESDLPVLNLNVRW